MSALAQSGRSASVDVLAGVVEQPMAKIGHDESFVQAQGQIGKGGDKLISVFLSADEQREHGREMEEWRSNRFKTDYLLLIRPFSAVAAAPACQGCRRPNRHCVFGKEG